MLLIVTPPPPLYCQRNNNVVVGLQVLSRVCLCAHFQRHACSQFVTDQAEILHTVSDVEKAVGIHQNCGAEGCPVHLKISASYSVIEWFLDERTENIYLS